MAPANSSWTDHYDHLRRKGSYTSLFSGIQRLPDDLAARRQSTARLLTRARCPDRLARQESTAAIRPVRTENGKLRIALDSVGGELIAGGDKLLGFSIAGADRKFVPAEALIEGGAVVLSAPAVAAPVAARYGFEQFVSPLCNLYNKEGLPASPFRTDDWPLEQSKAQ
ncbi:MAG: hypothetical protein ABSG68_01300 [Thermoguttaceae bacterium]